MKDKYGNEIKVGDEVAFALYDEDDGECYLHKAPIKSMKTFSVVLDLRGLNISDCSEYEGGLDRDGDAIFLEEFEALSSNVILVKRKEEK